MPAFIKPQQLLDLPETERSTIPNDYVDLMGHMNVMWYTHYFSNATLSLFRQIGLTTDYMREHQAGSFALEAHVQYYAEVVEGEEIVVFSRVLGRSAKRFHLMHFMTVRGERLASTTEFVSAHIDLQHRRMSNLPDSIAVALDRLIAEHAKVAWEAPVCGVMGP